MPPWNENYEEEQARQRSNEQYRTVVDITEDLLVTQYGYKWDGDEAVSTPEYDQLITVNDRYFLMSLHIDIE